MSYNRGNVVLALLLAGLLVPVGTIFAHGDEQTNWRMDHDTGYWERQIAREVRAYEREEAHEYARLKREEERVERYLARYRARLCERIEDARERLDVDFSVPKYCETEESPQAPTLTLSATPTTIVQGASSTLSWSTTNATTCAATLGWSGARATSGVLAVAPLATTTYTLECAGLGGTTTKSVTVGVTVVPPDVLPLPSVTLSALPQSVPAGASSTLSWSTADAEYCEALGGWSGVKGLSGSSEVAPAATTTYTLACGNETGTTTKSVEVAVAVAPAPLLGKVVLSEILYDLGTGQGAEPANEWVELYNGTGAAVDVAGWKLKDPSATSTIATTSPLMVPAGGYVVVAASSTTAGVWGLSPSSVVLVTGKQLGNSLGNMSDSLQLLNPANTVIDAVSWGGDMGAFDSTGLSAPAGSSIARVPVTTDTNAKADWVVLATPTPGI